jgi:hypothetical protein
MRKLITVLASASAAAAFTVPGIVTAATSVGRDTRVTRQTYVRHDGGTDAAIEICNNTDPAEFGHFTQNNEPFSVVDPTNPDLLISGWNDYCGNWMGLGFSTDGGRTWTNSLVPGYPQDTSAEGMQSPEFIRTNSASDPVGAFNGDGTMFYFGAISFDENAGPHTNSDVWVARYAVLEPGDPGYATYPLDYLGTTPVGQGPPAANFAGIFHDKEMIEVDRSCLPWCGRTAETTPPTACSSRWATRPRRRPRAAPSTPSWPSRRTAPRSGRRSGSPACRRNRTSRCSRPRASRSWATTTGSSWSMREIACSVT